MWLWVRATHWAQAAARAFYAGRGFGPWSERSACRDAPEPLPSWQGSEARVCLALRLDDLRLRSDPPLLVNVCRHVRDALGPGAATGGAETAADAAWTEIEREALDMLAGVHLGEGGDGAGLEDYGPQGEVQGYVYVTHEVQTAAPVERAGPNVGGAGSATAGDGPSPAAYAALR